MQGSAHRDLGSKPVRQARTKTVYVIGVFDLFHRGHLAFLEHARALGSRLVVAINGDAMVASYKRKPFHSEQDRLTIVRALRCVDEAFVIHGYDNRRPMLEHEVDIVVHGNDWEADSYMEQIRVDSAFLERHRIELCFIPYTDGVSTSSIIETIRRSAS